MVICMSRHQPGGASKNRGIRYLKAREMIQLYFSSGEGFAGPKENQNTVKKNKHYET
jgi:hypothetical protein